MRSISAYDLLMFLMVLQKSEQYPHKYVFFLLFCLEVLLQKIAKIRGLFRFWTEMHWSLHKAMHHPEEILATSPLLNRDDFSGRLKVMDISASDCIHDMRQTEA